MNRNKGLALTDVIVVVVLAVVLAGTLVWADLLGWESSRRTSCMNNVRQIGLAMHMYAMEHDERFPKLIDAKGNVVDAVDAKGNVSKEPARSAFAVLLRIQYLTTTKVFVCPSSGDKVAGDEFPKDFGNARLQDLILAEHQCSYGWDPTKALNADASCALIADKPSRDVSPQNRGNAKNNSDNHEKEGQNIWHIDGHVKWMREPKPDGGKDPDIYLGDKDWWKSLTDAKIIR